MKIVFSKSITVTNWNVGWYFEMYDGLCKSRFLPLRSCRQVCCNIISGLQKLKSSKFDSMKVLTLNIPDNIDVDNKELAMLVASRLYEQGNSPLDKLQKWMD
jgi:hypothetical protein